MLFMAVGTVADSIPESSGACPVHSVIRIITMRRVEVSSGNGIGRHKHDKKNSKAMYEKYNFSLMSHA
jgi:hypothetical protein